MAISLSNPHQLVSNQTIQDIGFQGQIINTFSGNHIFSQVNDQATAIDFGYLVARSTANTCKAPSATTDLLIGITARQFKASTVTSNQVFYNQNDTVAIADQCLDGIVCVAAENANIGDYVVAVIGNNGATGARNTTNSTSVTAAKAGGNTGNGTLVKDASTPLLSNYQDGIYTITCTVASTNAATFRVVDPVGRVLGDVSFSGSGASATFSNQIKFAITDGSTDFVVGDAFTFTVNANRLAANGANGQLRAQWMDAVTAGSLGRVKIQAL